MKATIFGEGINDSGYVTQKSEYISRGDGTYYKKLLWFCPYYSSWRGMITRCYSKAFQKKYPAYIGCTVSEEWKTFSNFKSWMEEQDWEGKHLDKDLLIDGNKVYSRETCLFIPNMINNFIVDNKASRGEFPVGVMWDNNWGKFRASVRNYSTKKQEHLGSFICPNEAHKAWGKRKYELAVQLAAEQTDERVSKALVSRYEMFSDILPNQSDPRGDETQ